MPETSINSVVPDSVYKYGNSRVCQMDLRSILVLAQATALRRV